MITYKINVLDELKKHGFNTNRIRKEKIFSEGTIQSFRNNEVNITSKTLNTLCIILRCQPSDILEVVPSDDEKIRLF